MLTDFRYAIRALGRARGFTVIAVGCLALGIGVNTAVFTVVNALLLRPFPFHAPEQVVSVYTDNPRTGQDENNVSAADLADWRAAGGVFQDVGAMYNRSFALAGGDEAERVAGVATTPNVFAMLGVAPALGRTFRPEEGVAGGAGVVILGDGVWTRRFGARRDIVGQKVLLNGAPFTVVGVMPPRFKFPETAEVWVPYALDVTEPRSERYHWAIGRLKPGVTAERAQAALAAVNARLVREHPATNAGWQPRVKTFREDMIEPQLHLMLTLMLGAVGFVLLIACANVANLLLARATTRQREIAVRTALGAGRARIVRQLLAESMLIALAGGALGVLIADWWVELLVKSTPEELPYWIDFSSDARVLAYTLLLSLATAVVFGLVPALRASGADPQSALKEGGRAGTGGRERQRLRGALVVGEIALSVVLLVGAVLVVKSFLAAARADAGFDTSRLLTMRTYLAGDRYAGAAARVAFFDQAAARLGALPGVRGVVATTAIPTDDGGLGTSAVAEGHPVAPGDETMVSAIGSTAGAFEVLGTPIVAGRAFTAAEARDTAGTAVVVNQALAARLWPNESAVGRRVHLGLADSTRWFTVVGVARDLQYEEFGEETVQSRLQVHLPYARMPWRTAALLVRTAGDPGALAAPVRREIRAIDGTLPTYDVRTMDEVRHFTTWTQRLWGNVFGSFAMIAIVLAAAGVYGVVSYGVAQRTHEIGIRVALGARRGDVVRLVVSQGVLLAGAGVAVGLLGAYAVTRVLAGALYGVSVNDPGAFLSVPLLLAGVAILASWLPARRAARVDPMVALRSE